MTTKERKMMAIIEAEILRLKVKIYWGVLVAVGVANIGWLAKDLIEFSVLRIAIISVDVMFCMFLVVGMVFAIIRRARKSTAREGRRHG